jgi:hypothetical protein
MNELEKSGKYVKISENIAFLFYKEIYMKYLILYLIILHYLFSFIKKHDSKEIWLNVIATD